jgi:hypothetical protein
MSDTNATMALGLLDSTITTAYTALRDLGLGADPTRDAILGQVADTIAVVAEEIDGAPADDDEGGVRTR